MESKKGKERAQSQIDRDIQNTISDVEGSSFLSRVSASANGLTNSLFTAPAGNELNDITQSTLSSSGKASSSNGGRNGVLTAAESSTKQDPPVGSQNLSEGIRLGHSEQHITQAEQEFSSFLDDIDTFVPSEQTITNSNGPEVGVDQAFEYAWARSRAVGQSPFELLPRSVQDQQSRDGEEVLAILSDPNSMDDQFEQPPSDEDLEQDWGLSDQQLFQLRAITREIFQPFELHQGVSPDNPLNLTPGLEGRSLGGLDTDLGSRAQDVQTREHWQEQWHGVLTRYADEVWGGLLPLVKDARKEIAEIHMGSAEKEPPKALRRLGAILGHLQQRK